MNYKLLASGVQRIEDGACIPPDLGNVDWQKYQAFLAAGGVPLPADPKAQPDNAPAQAARLNDKALGDLSRAIDAGDTITALKVVQSLLQGK